MRRYFGFKSVPHFHFTGYLGLVNSPRSSRVPEFGRPDAHEIVIGATTHKMAPVEPLDVNGVRTMAVGTALWTVVLVGLLPFWSTLDASGRTWWIWTALAGVGIGLLGFEYCRSRTTREPLSASAAPNAAAKLAALTESKPSRQTVPVDVTPESPPERHSFRKPPPLSELEDKAEDKALEEATVTEVSPSTVPPPASTEIASNPRPVGRRRKPDPVE